MWTEDALLKYVTDDETHGEWQTMDEFRKAHKNLLHIRREYDHCIIEFTPLCWGLGIDVGCVHNIRNIGIGIWLGPVFVELHL